MKKRRNPITRERGRTEKLLANAISHNWKCYVSLHIANGMSHIGILDELFEDFMRPVKRISFSTVEIPAELCIHSNRWGCIVPEDTVIVNGKLPRDLFKIKPPTYVDINSEASQVWHFTGNVYLIYRETCFCEYDANKREGEMLIFFDGEDIPQLLAKYPRIERKIKVTMLQQHSWLEANW